MKKIFCKWADQHPLITSILCGAFGLTCIGLLLILPIVLTAKFSAWFLLLYLPIAGGAGGLMAYLDS